MRCPRPQRRTGPDTGTETNPSARAARPRPAAPDRAPNAQAHHRSCRIEIAAPTVIAPPRTRNNRARLTAEGVSFIARAARPMAAEMPSSPDPDQTRRADTSGSDRRDGIGKAGWQWEGCGVTIHDDVSG